MITMSDVDHTLASSSARTTSVMTKSCCWDCATLRANFDGNGDRIRSTPESTNILFNKTPIQIVSLSLLSFQFRHWQILLTIPWGSVIASCNCTLFSLLLSDTKYSYTPPSIPDPKVKEIHLYQLKNLSLYIISFILYISNIRNMPITDISIVSWHPLLRGSTVVHLAGI